MNVGASKPGRVKMPYILLLFNSEVVDIFSDYLFNSPVKSDHSAEIDGITNHSNTLAANEVKKKTKKMKSMAPSVQNKTRRRQSRPPSQLWRRRVPLRHVSEAAVRWKLYVDDGTVVGGPEEGGRDGEVWNGWGCDGGCGLGELMEEEVGMRGVDKEKEYSRYLPLYKAVLRGDWATAERFFDQDPGALTARINEFSRTALYVAAVHGRNTNDFVKKLVDKMPPGSVDEAYGSVLNWAAYVGNTEAVKVILSKNPSLVYYKEDDTSPNKMTPFTRAATNGMRDTLLYLLELVKNDEDSSKLFPDEDSAAFFMAETISSGFYGNTNTLLEFTSLIVLFLHN
ncbi:hypothetical protein RHMOL_Rhmol13G0279700 [Rhododendron molle]|uniref:Uncharacterized protein n=1 Tax=Rhododendron molle TaxID=49168 RepID=A0ACC0LCK3_RHOML|nr:hypothetical protein RHMOL_Rhmol13G0279700 [Rhododendron molle]